jgi:hypothetical protein
MLTASWLVMSALALAEPLQAPFRTTLPWSLRPGGWEIAAGVSREAESRPAFFTDEPDFRRDLWRAGLVDVTWGAGPRSEVRIEAGWQRFHEEGGRTASGIEDVRLSFTHQLPVEPIATALRCTVKLPNASDAKRLGTDQTDVFLSVAAGWRNPTWGAVAEAGLGILGNPRALATQDDVAMLGLAGWRFLGSDRPLALLSLEASGLAASRFGNDVRRATAGLTLLGRIPVTLLASRGLTQVSERWSVGVRVTLAHPSLSGS